ncbi:MAG: response regulator [Proteobacteria bacterium]|nr:MAG: response regulator [Pseudomonadota bacterium]
MTSITPRFRHRLLRFRRCGVGGMKLHNPGVCNRMNQLFSVSPEMRAEPEFQSALVRLGIWLFAVTYVGLTAISRHYAVDLEAYALLFGGYLIVFIAIVTSVFRRPVWQARRYFSMAVDISATTMAIYLTGEPINPFCAIYVWIFISYGTRYGAPFPFIASVLSIVAYGSLLTALGAWQTRGYEATFFLILFAVLPLYQQSLLNKLRAARREALSALEEADRANQAKTAFLANMSHEIRTPMNGVLAMTQLLQRCDLAPQAREYAQHIRTSGTTLLGILNDILDFCKVESGKLEIIDENFSLSALCKETTSLLQANAEAKGVGLRSELSPSLADAVFGARRQLCQVLVNLIGNAIKFTEHGHITLRVAPAKPEHSVHCVRFEVVDTGVGIAPEYQERIFTRFSQADTTRARTHSGTGLGLAISRKLIEALGGRIGFASEVGKGSVFWFEVDLPPGDATAIAAQSEPVPPKSPRSARILLVDDDHINRVAGQRLLEQDGHEVTTASDGHEALRELANRNYDVVLMDVHMPELDGVAATRRIRKGEIPHCAQIPIIGVTASILENENASYLHAGMNHVVAKPLNVMELNDIIARFLLLPTMRSAPINVSDGLP